MTTCRLCGHNKKLVKAHIIPESFFRAQRGNENTLLTVTDRPEAYPQRTPIGIYDKNLLCDQCETTFGDFDDYGAKVFLNQFEKFFEPTTHLGKTIGYRSSSVDQDMLLRFLVATLWRASASTHPFFNAVNLGSYEPLAKQTIQQRTQPVPKTFSAVLSRWSSSDAKEITTHGLMDPFQEKWDGVNAYRLYFGKIVAYIKVDRRPFPDSLEKLALLSGDQLKIVTRDFTKSSDLRAMVITAKKSHKNKINRKHHNTKNK